MFVVALVVVVVIVVIIVDIVVIVDSFLKLYLYFLPTQTVTLCCIVTWLSRVTLCNIVTLLHRVTLLHSVTLCNIVTLLHTVTLLHSVTLCNIVTLLHTVTLLHAHLTAQKSELQRASVLRSSQGHRLEGLQQTTSCSQQNKQLLRNVLGRKSANLSSECPTDPASCQLSRKHVSIADVTRQVSVDSCKLSSNLTLGLRPSDHPYLPSTLSSSRPHPPSEQQHNKSLLSPVMHNVLVDSGISSSSSSSSSKNLLPLKEYQHLNSQQQCMQDVSQITTVQVTPRPKPKAFPRTNPNLFTNRRR